MTEESRGLSNRYITTKCCKCNQVYTIDQGESEEYFDYFIKLKHETTTCPMCLNIRDNGEFLFNFVQN